MSLPVTITVNDKPIATQANKTILDACQENGVRIPTLCEFKGLSSVGACRLCLVEIEGSPKLFSACTTPVAPNQRIKTETEKLQNYRRMTIELLFAERNHICSVCVANNNCELQNIGYEVGMTKVRYPYLYPEVPVDGSHRLYVMDHNRCIMCTRCVRVCHEVEGAHTWDVLGRGTDSRITADFNQPWGESESCTDCGKCVDVCPVGALWSKSSTIGMLNKSPDFFKDLIDKRKHTQIWIKERTATQPNVPTFHDRRKPEDAGPQKG